MRKLVCVLLLLAALMALTAGTTLAGSQDFTLINQTGKPIIALYLKPSEDKEWEEDDALPSLPGGAIRSDESVDITFTREDLDKVKYWDLRADFNDGTYTEWFKFDLLSTYEITLKKDSIAEYK